MLALADDRGLHLLDFVDRRGLERALTMLQKRLHARVLPGEHRHLAQIERELREYFDGTRTTFDTPVALTGSPFQTRVWRALQDIPQERRGPTASSPRRSASRARCARSAAPTATTGCRSSSPAIA